jgi:hypothetical protein
MALLRSSDHFVGWVYPAVAGWRAQRRFLRAVSAASFSTMLSQLTSGVATRVWHVDQKHRTAAWLQSLGNYPRAWPMVPAPSPNIPYDLLPFCDSIFGSAFGGGANRLLRLFAGNGVKVMVTLRPVIFGSISTCDIPERSSRTFSMSCMPNS